MKSRQSISKTEIRLTRQALRLAMAEVGNTPACDWLSSRQGKRPHNLERVLGGSGYYQKEDKQ
jgi:hypothetical protein